MDSPAHPELLKAAARGLVLSRLFTPIQRAPTQGGARVTVVRPVAVRPVARHVVSRRCVPRLGAIREGCIIE